MLPSGGSLPLGPGLPSPEPPRGVSQGSFVQGSPGTASMCTWVFSPDLQPAWPRRPCASLMESSLWVTVGCCPKALSFTEPAGCTVSHQEEAAGLQPAGESVLGRGGPPRQRSGVPLVAGSTGEGGPHTCRVGGWAWAPPFSGDSEQTRGHSHACRDLGGWGWSLQEARDLLGGGAGQEVMRGRWRLGGDGAVLPS